MDTKHKNNKNNKILIKYYKRKNIDIYIFFI